MHLYETNPNVWAPPPANDEPRLFVVLVPENETIIPTLERYQELLCRRLEWLMDVWLEEAEECSPEETQAMLYERTRGIWVYTKRPMLPKQPWTPEELQEWKRAWVRFLVWENDLLDVRLSMMGVDFPVAVETDPERKAELLSMFWTPDIPTPLESWVIGIIDPMLR
jgi:hypothetical protein